MYCVLGGTSMFLECNIRYADHNHPNNCHAAAQNLIIIHLHPQYQLRKEKSRDNGTPSHHQVHRSRHIIQRNVMQSGADKIAKCRHCEQELVHLYLLSFAAGGQHTHLVSLRVPVLNIQEHEEC